MAEERRGPVQDDDTSMRTVVRAPSTSELSAAMTTGSPGSVRLDPEEARLEARPTDRLVVRRRIGEGGMGEVVEVDDLALVRRLARKTIRAGAQDDPAMRALFVREARITGQLDHPSIVPVHELGISEDGLYFTMKLVQGRTLAEVAREAPDEPLERSRLLDLLEAVLKVCDALAFAHERGVMHCDLKASNVMIGQHGQVYLMDWGAARLLPSSESSGVTDGLERAGSLPPASALYGTPSHMASEQAIGEPDLVDVRTDVFLVGALLYEVLTGHPPYRGDGVRATLSMAALGRYVPLDATPRGAALPSGLVRIVERAMRRQREDRYPTVSALREDLVRFVRGEVDFPKITVVPGTIVVREGEPAGAGYRIVRGRCVVFSEAGGGPTQPLATLGPGACFGEVAILSPGPRTSSVVAIEETELEVVTRDAFEHELATAAPWFTAFVRALADRFRNREP